LRDFVRIAFENFGLDWQQFTSTDTNLFRPSEIIRSVGDPGEALTNLNWSPKVPIEKIVQNMCNEIL
jgi:GDP-D-mannose dehydratase